MRENTRILSRTSKEAEQALASLAESLSERTGGARITRVCLWFFVTLVVFHAVDIPYFDFVYVSAPLAANAALGIIICIGILKTPDKGLAKLVSKIDQLLSQ